MNIIQNNPYRVLGLLVGATATQFGRHRTRIPSYISADADIPIEFTDFSFATLGNLHMTIDNVSDAASKLNLDSDKINAALFWFYKGNPITDEPAFDAIKEGDFDQALNIWTKLTSNGEVSQRNASAYSNLGTLYLSGILEGTNTTEALLEQGVSLKLKFLESDFIKDFKALATDETYKATKKDLQLLFLNRVQSEIENNSGVSSNKFLDIINKQEFIAKEDFLKGFVQKPIEEIEKKIENAKNNHKVEKANGVNIGEVLYKQTAENLKQLKCILGVSNIKYASLADKVANEILQCSIDFFNYYQENESDIDYFEPAWNLAKSAGTVAIGKLTKDRIIDSLNTLEEMKDKEITQATQLLQSIKAAYEENERKIRQQVKQAEETDIEIGKYIDQSLLKEHIKNSINWQHVNELLVTALTDNKLKKIKESDNNEQKIQFLELANWLRENSLKDSTISSIINKYKNISPKLPFKILSSEVTNTENKPLYTKFIRYVGLNLKVQVTEDKTVTFYIKYINPKGNFERNPKISPIGYTLVISQNLNSLTKSIIVPGWGISDKCTFDIGEHRIEVYVDEYLIHSKNFVVDLAPSEKLELELKKAEDKLKEIKNTQYFKSELSSAQNEMSKIKQWQLFRSQADRERQINDQQRKINIIFKRTDTEKSSQINKQQTLINEIISKIQKAEY